MLHIDRCQRPYCGGQYLWFDEMDEDGLVDCEYKCSLCSWVPGGEDAAEQRRLYLDENFPQSCPSKEHKMTGENVELNALGSAQCKECRIRRSERRELKNKERENVENQAGHRLFEDFSM